MTVSSDAHQKGAAQPEKRIAYLERKIQRLQESQLRQEKLDDINRHLLNNALSELEIAREKSEMASRSKTEFLTNMSHEIRTPLNIIMGLGELLEETELNGRQQQFVRNLRGAGHHLLEIIDSILEFSRIEKGDVEVVEAPFNLRRLVHNLTGMLETLARKKGLRFRVEWRGEIDQIYLGDKGKIKQVLLNLLSNAIKFTEQGEVRLVIRRDENVGEGLVFQVSDTGIGISDEEKSAIFERFSQARATFSRKQGGVGLGLAIVRILVDAMGGSIVLASGLGKGTMFTVHLPISAGMDKDDRVAAGQGGRMFPDLSQMRLLVVDDMVGNREVVQYYLEGLPVKAKYADSGRRAIELCVQQKFDLVLLDISMPEIDGITAIREIREIERQKAYQPSRIVAMTAHAFQEIKESLLDEGFDEILTKPFSKTDLLAVLAGLSDADDLPLNPQLQTPSAVSCWENVDIPSSLVTLIPKFLEIMLCEHEKMIEPLRAGDFQCLADLSHANKGVAGMYGFSLLVEIFEELEVLANSHDAERGKDAWDDLGRLLSDLADTCPVTDT